MLTQVCYWSLYGSPNVWCTVSSDKYYSGASRLTLQTLVKPTDRQVRRLHKKARRQTKDADNTLSFQKTIFKI